MAVDTYYFNGHTNLAENNVTGINNAVDGNTGTSANFTNSAAEAWIVGTTAPSSGTTITSARARLHNGISWQSYTTLTEPSESWSWNYVSNVLAVYIYNNGAGILLGEYYDYDDFDPSDAHSGTATPTISRVEIEVTHEDPAPADFNPTIMSHMQISGGIM